MFLGRVGAQEVAIKRYRRSNLILSYKMRMLQNEAKVLRDCSHPGII